MLWTGPTQAAAPPRWLRPTRLPLASTGLRTPAAATATDQRAGDEDGAEREIGAQRPTPARAKPAIGEQQDDEWQQQKPVFPGITEDDRHATQRQSSVMHLVVQVGVGGTDAPRLHRERHGDQQPSHRVARLASGHHDPDGREGHHDRNPCRGFRDVRRRPGILVREQARKHEQRRQRCQQQDAECHGDRRCGQENAAARPGRAPVHRCWARWCHQRWPNGPCRIQTEAWVGWTARLTTSSRSARMASISTASRSRAVKAATVASAS